MNDTIFALSSGSPPAAIAVMRISGPATQATLRAICGGIPAPRRASLRTLRVSRETVLDRAIVLWFPGPDTATGEDLAEFHLHGGRAVVDAVARALETVAGLRPALAGEFTRRAFANGRIDLAEAEGLSDLLSAETELQRLNAIAMAGGRFSRQVEAWRGEVLHASAMVEAALDFEDEDDVPGMSDEFGRDLRQLASTLSEWLDRPRAETLKEGFRVVLAGPPNAGKSTLFNAILDDDAAIVSPQAGTTRDVLTRHVSLDGVPLVISDTAGLREGTTDDIEAIGIDKARAEAARADLVLWLGDAAEAPAHCWVIASKSDQLPHGEAAAARHALSPVTGAGMEAFTRDLIATARQSMPRPGEVALNRRQRGLIDEACAGITAALGETNLLLMAEGLRLARSAFDRLIGSAATEDMLDTLFSRFCIGK